MGSVSAQNRKSCNTAIRSACPRRLRHTRRSSSAAVTGCAASPCSSGSAQPRAPACGRARAGCASGRGGAPTRRAACGARDARAAGVRLRAGSAIRNTGRIPQDRRGRCSARIGGRSGCGRCVDKIPYRIGTKYSIPWSDAKTSDTGRTTPSCPSAFRQGWTQRRVCE